MPSGKNKSLGKLFGWLSYPGFATGLSLSLGLLLWEVGVRWLNVKPVILPPPSGIAHSLMASWRVVLYHAGTTVVEILLGFSLGALAAIMLAVAFHLIDTLRAVLQPYLVISQLVPKVALAPLFIIWLGFGMSPKILIAALVCFFPTFINTFQGLSAHDPDLALMMRCLRASRLETLLKLQMPFAVPYITAGLKTSALLSVTGCVIGEFVGSDQGLGFLLMQAEAQLDTPLLFAALSVLAAMGALFYALPAVMESSVLKRFMPVHRSDSNWLQE